MNIKELLPQILEATKRKKMKWAEVTESTFNARLGDRKLQISHAYDHDIEESSFRLNIYSGGHDSPFDGRFLDALYADQYKGPYSDLEDLYAEARRSALGIDSVISEISDELAKLLK